ncbi:hypothetical protein HF1_04010 [Mycoplasma haemofelis str. Langford 1]|uniref:Uncharacterized protein n=1 Tax=Mycoplasma haemofelis (strain Langford 1) TaxID=941640 RepID=E8ZGY8_MYCHL|nr:hypothetical protein [Mycoplasma haemofelis]CBY92409.1 hypothetical protein HF1_04010 [Mycoplasma haemofelis str. Langford 1]
MKLATVAGVTAGVGGAAIGGSILLKNSNSYPAIEELISKSKTKILVKDSDTKGWTALWDVYKKENTNNGLGKDTWRLEGWESSSKTTNILTSYKSKCFSLAKEKVKDADDQKYKEFVSKCARNKTVADLLAGSTLLSSDAGNKEQWKERFKKYKALKTQNTSYPIKEITLGDSDVETDDQHLKKIQDGCDKAWNREVDGTESEQSILDIKKWCSSETTI